MKVKEAANVDTPIGTWSWRGMTPLVHRGDGSEAVSYLKGYRDVTEEALREDAQHDGAFGYHLPMFPPSPIEEAAKQIQREATRATCRAVEGWAAQMGVTPEVWLETYYPHVEIVPVEDNKGAKFEMKVTVTAKLRGGVEYVFPPGRSR